MFVKNSQNQTSMKKIYFLLIIGLIALTGPAMAQKELYFGLGGTGLSSWTTNQNNYGLPFEMDYSMTFGGSGNINAGFEFNKHLGIKLEIGYSKMGQNYKDQIGDSTYTRKIKMNYLQIPLLFKYRTGGEVAKFYFLVGPQFNLLLSANQKYLRNDTPEMGEINNPNTNKPIVIGESDIKDRYTSYDIMGRIDVGVDIEFTKNLFMNVGLTMAYGFMDINATDWRINDKDGNYNASHNIYGGFNVGINYRFEP
jgi:hypothetical protein